jgi:peroxidase
MGDPRYSKLSDGTLMIENTLDSDVGVYECMAKNPAGEAKSRAAKMHYQKTKGKSLASSPVRFAFLFERFL